jgi:hypothetical protein
MRLAVPSIQALIFLLSAGLSLHDFETILAMEYGYDDVDVFWFDRCVVIGG